MSSTTGYESRDEACPLDLLHVSGLESNRTSSSIANGRCCPNCGFHLSDVAREISKLRETVKMLEEKHHRQSVRCPVTKHRAQHSVTGVVA